MVDKKTSRLLLKYLDANQSQKEVTHNEALNILDALVHLSVLDKDLATPPVSPAEGDRYIVASGATGAWDDKDGNIAEYKDAIWVFYTPVIGWLSYVQDETILYLYGSGGWSNLPSLITSLQNLSMLGINATADATNKLSINSAASLFNHNGAGHQIKANKNAAGDTVSHLFQTGFSGRAELGLIGDDDFTLKVSPDGSSFNDALKANKTTGLVNFPQGLTLGAYTDILKDYVIGTFTPTIYGANNDGATTYTVQSGYYTRIGNIVIAQGRVAWSNFTHTGVIRLGGLPINLASGTEKRGMVNWQYYNSLNFTAGEFISGFAEPNTDYIRILRMQTNSMGTAATVTEISTSGELYYTTIYRVT